MSTGRSFRYLNGEGRWLGFQLEGLDLSADGALRLDHLPRLEGSTPEGLAELPLPDGPAGVVVLPDGTVVFSDPAGHCLLRTDCDGGHAPVPCVGGPSALPTGVHIPRGLWYLPGRQALAVADSANHRVLILDAGTFTPQSIWGSFGTGDGEFQTLTALAADSDGNLYVVDTGNRRVQKLDRAGRAQPAFWRTVQQQVTGADDPADVTVAEVAGEVRVFALDAGLRQVLELRADGSLVATTPAGALHRPLGLAAAGDSLYVGDNDHLAPGSPPGTAPRPRILRFKRLDPPAWTLVGEAVGYAGPVAALGLASDGLWVHTGDAGSPPLRLASRGGYGRAGLAWGGPFANPSQRSEQWHRLKASVHPLADGGHVRLFFARSRAGARPTLPVPPPPPPPPPAALSDLRPDPAGARPALDVLYPRDEAIWPPPKQPPLAWEAVYPQLAVEPGPRVTGWLHMPLDVGEGMFPGGPEEDLWVGVELLGDGLASPVLSQLRLDFDQPTLLPHLPAIFQAEPDPRAFLARFVSLFESLFGDTHDSLDALSRWFDPAAVPEGFLGWLAGWLALDLDERLDEADRRRALAAAFEVYARRGTAAGMMEAIRLFSGLDVRVEAPIDFAGWWALAADEPSAGASDPTAALSVLGFSTMLAAAEPQGAVVGTTATLDGSHLIAAEDFGSPLFDDLAHRITVHVYQGQHFSPDTVREVQAIIDREKPAHVAAHLCVVRPSLRIGFQARIGVDTVLAGSSLPGRLGEEEGSGGLVLAGEPAGRMDGQVRLGQGTRLADF